MITPVNPNNTHTPSTVLTTPPLLLSPIPLLSPVSLLVLVGVNLQELKYAIIVSLTVNKECVYVQSNSNVLVNLFMILLGLLFVLNC